LICQSQFAASGAHLDRCFSSPDFIRFSFSIA
jgi:hypothetical protein